jgi:hypothetical protein
MAVLFLIVHIVVITAISLQVYRKQEALKKVFWPALSVKLISGACLGLLYTYYYTVSDTFSYFNDAARIATLATTDFSAYLRFLFHNTGFDSLQLVLQEPRALFLTKVASVFNLLTRNNYWATGLYFSFACFLGTWHLVQVINRYVPSASSAAVIAFLFLPSAVFWTSGLLKESLSMATLCYLSGFFLRIWFEEKPQLRHFVMAAVCLWIFWSLKYYYTGVFVAVVGTSLLYKFLIGKRFLSSARTEMLIWFSVLVIPLAVVSLLHPNFYFHRLLDVIVMNNTTYNELSAAENLVMFHNLHPSPGSILENAPWALFSGLFRPMLWEVTSMIKLLAASENLLLLLAFVVACTRIRGYSELTHRLLILSVVVYVIVLCVFLTLSAPNLGTLSRYRTGYISFFTFIILCNNPALQFVERSISRLVRNKAGFYL